MRTIWAFITPDGRILADSTFRDEKEAWTIGLGWPSEREVVEAKKRGYKVEQVTVQLQEEAAGKS